MWVLTNSRKSWTATKTKIEETVSRKNWKSVICYILKKDMSKTINIIIANNQHSWDSNQQILKSMASNTQMTTSSSASILFGPGTYRCSLKRRYLGGNGMSLKRASSGIWWESVTKRIEIEWRNSVMIPPSTNLGVQWAREMSMIAIKSIRLLEDPFLDRSVVKKKSTRLSLLKL